MCKRAHKQTETNTVIAPFVDEPISIIEVVEQDAIAPFRLLDSHQVVCRWVVVGKWPRSCRCGTENSQVGVRPARALIIFGVAPKSSVLSVFFGSAPLRFWQLFSSSEHEAQTLKRQ